MKWMHFSECFYSIIAGGNVYVVLIVPLQEEKNAKLVHSLYKRHCTNWGEIQKNHIAFFFIFVYAPKCSLVQILLK